MILEVCSRSKRPESIIDRVAFINEVFDDLRCVSLSTVHVVWEISLEAGLQKLRQCAFPSNDKDLLSKRLR